MNIYGLVPVRFTVFRKVSRYGEAIVGRGVEARFADQGERHLPRSGGKRVRLPVDEESRWSRWATPPQGQEIRGCVRVFVAFVSVDFVCVCDLCVSCVYW